MKSKLEEIRAHKVVPAITHKFDLVLLGVVKVRKIRVKMVQKCG